MCKKGLPQGYQKFIYIDSVYLEVTLQPLANKTDTEWAVFT